MNLPLVNGIFGLILVFYKDDVEKTDWWWSKKPKVADLT